MRLERRREHCRSHGQCTRLNCLSDKEADATFVAKEGRRPCHCISSKELSTSWATRPMETRSASKPTSAIIGICSAGSGRVERQGTCSTSDRRDRYPGDILSRTPLKLADKAFFYSMNSGSRRSSSIREAQSSLRRTVRAGTFCRARRKVSPAGLLCVCGRHRRGGWGEGVSSTESSRREREIISPRWRVWPIRLITQDSFPI